MNKKASVIISTVVGAALIGGGIPLGIFLSDLFSFNGVDYSNLDASANEDNAAALIRRYEADKGKSATELSMSYSGAELVMIAENNVGKHENAQTIGVGLVNAAMGVKQSIYSSTVKKGDTYFMENLSKSSFVACAKRFYQANDEVQTYTGEIIDEKSATWNETADSSLSLEEHDEKWGKDLSRSSIYIVSSKTVLSQEVSQDGDNLKIHLSLDPINSVIRYVKQMVNVSDLAAPPAFHTVDITYTIDQNMNLLQRDINEVYDVTSFGVVSKNTSGHLVEKLYYDGDYQFPSLSEHFDYSDFE